MPNQERLKPGTQVKVVRPDGNDLRQGIEKGLLGVILDTPDYWNTNYPHLYKVRLPKLSDECVFYLEDAQLEVVS